MIISKKAISRRTILRGLGAAVALPVLDAMSPAMAAPGKAPMRLGTVYIPNGVIMEDWTPATLGSGFEVTPTLAPLASFRDRLLVLSGLAQNQGRPLPGEGAGDHPRASAAFLTGVHTLAKSKEREVLAAVSMDQVAAKHLGKSTQLASLELGLESGEVESACDSGFSCAYNNTISWRTPTTPLPMSTDPRIVFERLFGDNESTDPAERMARIKEDRSLLDSMTEGVSRLVSGLGPRDRSQLSQYLEAIRDVERRIQLAEKQAAQELPALEKPEGAPTNYEKHAKLMFDLQVLAFQCDLTRVGTVMMGREQSLRTYPEIGIPDPHHPMTHHAGDQDKIEKVRKINLYHTRMFSYFLERLRATPDGDGSLLDHSMILYGSSLSDGNLHLHDNLPIVLAGGISKQFKGGRHVRYPDGTPMTNLFLTMLDKLEVPIDRLGDSTGKLELLSI